MTVMGELLNVGDSQLWVEQRGDLADPTVPPLLILHGGPGLDHHEFGDYLDPLGERFRLVFVDQRAQGRSARDCDTHGWTLHQMARDVSAIAAELGVERYAVLGHSYGAFVALQHAVDGPGAAVATIISSGLPSSRWLTEVAANLATFEPVELRARVAASWERETSVATEAEFAELMADQLPFHFRDPLDPRIEQYRASLAGTRYAPAVLRHFSGEGYGGIEVQDRLRHVRQPVLVLAGRHDRICPVAAAEAMAASLPNAELVVFENSAHTAFVEEQDRYLSVVGDFLERAFSAVRDADPITRARR
jgi:proline iminopeptidase